MLRCNGCYHGPLKRGRPPGKGEKTAVLVDTMTISAIIVIQVLGAERQWQDYQAGLQSPLCGRPGRMVGTCPKSIRGLQLKRGLALFTKGSLLKGHKR